MKPVTGSSGNVFEDLGFANSKELLAKAELARQVYLILKKRGLTQTAAAELLRTEATRCVLADARPFVTLFDRPANPDAKRPGSRCGNRCQA